ncbi:hypothetical protein D9619_011472 [Psilocybe cf. subviscida]|uniref:Fe2OG dioxygenase domain-containing protein n=1 Tax=Psilocybe cf. subviscida TaxID=2480587 RepID=A0A8H5F9C0_9AGAR|nr:hypothetical protein D9619_011472 [Psilocybe cf. subviscida]
MDCNPTYIISTMTTTIAVAVALNLSEAPAAPTAYAPPSGSGSGADFSSIPILNYTLLSTPTGKAQFLTQLRHALINVGFLYLQHPPVSPSVIAVLTHEYIPALFALPQEAKDAVSMRNLEHFLGYSKLGAELTKGKVDQREQWDIATMHECWWREGRGDPEHWRLWGPSQWPNKSLLPSFRPIFESYLAQVEALSYEFASLISEAFGLGSHGLDRFYDDMTGKTMQHRAKVVKYPAVKEGEEGQGVGPHYDAGFLTFLLQASPHRGLQVQNLASKWIDAPPIPDTFVVNIGKALEFITGGLAWATSHRVISPLATPGKEATPRYSVLFFQNIGLDVRLGEHVLECDVGADWMSAVPPEILALRDARGNVAKTDLVNFSEFDREPSGKVNLIGHVKSHPDVAQIHYPALFKQYFPDGLPESGRGGAY